VSNNKKRSKIADILKDYGHRVQYSVFECNLERKHLQQMIEEMAPFFGEKSDSLRIYRLCNDCAGKVEILGHPDQFDKAEPIVI